jgi:hypothetical protein
VGWLLLVAAALVLGERPSTFAHLRAAVASGRVDVVATTPGLGRNDIGYAVVDLHWREHGLRYETHVLEARPRSQAPSRDSLDDVTAVVGTDVAAVLNQARGNTGPRLELVHHSDPGVSSYVRGWQVPAWLSLATLGLGVATLFLLVRGPEPWRATRWGWFWLMAVATPVGVPAFLALSGPAPLVRAPASAARLTGGRALLLALLVSVVLKAVL